MTTKADPTVPYRITNTVCVFFFKALTLLKGQSICGLVIYII